MDTPYVSRVEHGWQPEDAPMEPEDADRCLQGFALIAQDQAAEVANETERKAS